ncbi:N-acetylmuramoyl-L-alanine amidase [Neobacillus notoginsengisoli]|uniref:N-acetylmuramoyl-L-alanine amidase n=1 Tax=Neobacillus notoginsengisoli TaxID=1578198 RepID=A0A417YR54_9BACI|nr:GH25 family lysozyme [Neobacillus notoginsengisoli]RHW37332.1 N-acetylmuramoyl-L-alanine amidase [Neobacillus notoginsengisoli]
MMSKLIVDISHHQLSSRIDWVKAAAEVALFIIRVQYGSTTIDREYKKHVANAKKHGIPFGHYAYALFKDVEDAKKEAKNFLARADKDAKFLVVDVEEQTCRNAKDIVPATQAFIDVCKAAGWKVGLYTGHHFYKPHRMDQVKADFVWIPRYGPNSGKPETKPAYPCDIWQYTDKGRVSWFNSNLDLNQLIGIKSLEWFIGDQKQAAATKEKYPRRLIRNGSRGEDVKKIQRKVGTAADGIFGPKTEAAVKVWQRKNKLAADGIVGPLTWAKMF